MKRFFGIINLLLCFELIIGPQTPGLKLFSVAHADDTTCPSGLVFDSTLNRCITSDQQATVMNAAASCNGDKECTKRIAEDELKKAEQDGKIAESVANKGGLIGTAAKIAAIAGPLTVVMGAFKSKKCLNGSGIAMIAGGVAFTAGNFLADKKHKSCLKKIRDDWEAKKAATTETTSSGATKVSNAQAQSEAFEMLAKSEECMQSSAKMKAGFYAASTLAFGASAVMAGLEQFQHTPPPGPCTQAADVGRPSKVPYTVYNWNVEQQIHRNIQSSEDLASVLTNSRELSLDRRSSASIDEFYAYKKAFEDTDVENDLTVIEALKLTYDGLKKEFRIIDDARAQAEVEEIVVTGQRIAPVSIEAAPIATNVEGLTAAPQVNLTAAKPAGIIDKLNTPMARMIISGVLAGMSAMMWMHANKQAKVAGDRAAFLRKMKQDFNDANGAISCTAEERSMSANANCYCYTDDGQRNSSRTNSQVCQALWAGKSLAGAGTYNTLDFSNQRVCVSASGAPDESCSCAQTKSCLNAIPSSGSLGIGSVSVASTAGLKPLNDLVNGQAGAGSINGAAALSNAAKLLDQSKKLQAKAGINPSTQSAAAKQIQDGLVASSPGTPSPFAGSSSSPLPMNMSASQAAKMLEKELNTRSFEAINGSPAVAQPNGGKASEDPGFSLGSMDQVTPSTDQQMAEVMKQDLNYGQNDITKSDSNLFQILSNRYQRSAMRRLFDDEKKTTADQASKNDISQ